jgi:hypothetical protein
VDVVLSYHARQKMLQRSIDARMVQAALSRPLWSPPTTRGTRYDGLVEDGRRLCLVVDESGLTPVLVTAFWYEGE